MKALAEFLLSFESFRAALKALGWMPPAPKAFGPFPSGGPSAPPPPSTPSPQPSPPPNDN